jgi:hypothetical protein
VKNIVAVLKVEDFLKELHRLCVDFIIIGGMAAVAHRFPKRWSFTACASGF